MTFAGVLLLSALLPAQPGAGFTIEPEATERVPAVAAPGGFQTVRPAPPGFTTLALENSGAGVAKPGWPLPLKLLVAEASVAGLSSSGYIAKGAGEPAESGAYVLGASLAGLAAVGTMFVPWALADANTTEERKGTYVILVGAAALAAAGGYNLYLHERHDANASQIFRDNMIALNAVPLVTWGVAKVFHWPIRL